MVFLIQWFYALQLQQTIKESIIQRLLHDACLVVVGGGGGGL